MNTENTETETEKPQQKAVFELGITMRERREKRGKELAEVSDLLCIRRVYLEAIEEGRLDELPDGPYAVGFVRAYAKYLRMSEEKAVKTYKNYVGMVENPADLHFPIPTQEGGLPSRVMAIAGLALLVGVYAIWTNLQGGTPPAEMVQNQTQVTQKTETGAENTPSQQENTSASAETAQVEATQTETATETPETPVEDTAQNTDENTAENQTETTATEPTTTAENTDATPTETAQNPTATPETVVAETPKKEITTPEPAQTTPVTPIQVSDADRNYITDLSLSSAGNVWVLIRHDGKIVMERLMTAGENLQLAQYVGYTLDLGNAGVVNLNRNDTISKSLGQLGEVKEGLLLGSGLNIYFE